MKKIPALVCMFFGVILSLGTVWIGAFEVNLHANDWMMFPIVFTGFVVFVIGYALGAYGFMILFD